MVTLEDVKKNKEVIAFINAADRQLKVLRIYRTCESTY